MTEAKVDKSEAGIRARWTAKLKALAKADKALHKSMAAARRVLKRHAAAPAAPVVAKGALGVDWAWGSPDPQGLVAAGVKFACRYLSHDPRKDLTRAEALRLGRAGIPVVVVWETTAGRALEGVAAGMADAHEALVRATECGMPYGRPIYFAVDFDESPQQAAAVADYFKGVSSVLGVARTGAYGGYYVVKRLFDEGLIRFGWQTYAWSGGQWDKRAQLRQVSNGRKLAGVSCDFDRSVAKDFGQWLPA